MTQPRSDRAFEATIDWEQYWADADERDRADASPSKTLLLKPLLAFLEDRSGVESLADVGCGTGTVSFAVAERHPDVSVGGYDAVAPGGDLLLTYHNALAQAHFRQIAADPHEHLDDDSPWDPEQFADRFEAVLDGESLLSHERIHDVLGTWPRSVWSVVGEDDRYPAWRHNPFVCVPK